MQESKEEFDMRVGKQDFVIKGNLIMRASSSLQLNRHWLGIAR
jgi:hypothetical protein